MSVGVRAGSGSDHRVSGLEGEIQCAFEADGEPFHGVTSLEGPPLNGGGRAVPNNQARLAGQ